MPILFHIPNPDNPTAMNLRPATELTELERKAALRALANTVAPAYREAWAALVEEMKA